MSSVKDFLKRKDIVITPQRYLIEALGAMAQGLFASLLIGTIIKTLGQQTGLEVLVDLGGYASAMSGPAMACAIGWALHCPPLVLFSLITVGYSANALGGAGGPLAVLIIAIAAAELGRAIFGAGQTGSVRAVLLSNVLAAAAFVLLAALASVNASRLNRPGFAGKCICAVFLLWYLFELVRTAAMLQQACWEQFASMAFIGLLPFFLWAGWSLGCELYDRMASVLGWLVVLGIVFCVLGLAGQLQWQVLVTGETAHSFVLPNATFYPEYFSFPLLCMSKNNAKISKKPVVWLPIIAAVISSGYALGLALLFGAPQAYPGYELLRAWSFGGISRFDAAFLLLWLAAAIFRFGFIVRAVRLLCERLAEGPVNAEAAR